MSVAKSNYALIDIFSFSGLVTKPTTEKINGKGRETSRPFLLLKTKLVFVLEFYLPNKNSAIIFQISASNI
jgi:hypothetical protein